MAGDKREAVPGTGRKIVAAQAETLTDRIIAEISRGGSIPAIAARVGTSEIFVKTMADHLSRTGITVAATSLCATGHGACGPNGPLGEVAKVACAGCFFARR